MTSSNVVPDSEGEDSLPDVQAAPRGGDTFDNNGARGPPGASILQARRKNVSARDIHLSKQQIEDSGVHMLSVPPMLAEIEDSVDLTYTNRFNKAEKYIRVMTEVSITKPEADSLDVLLATGPTNGRSYSVSATLDSSTSSEWRFGIINQADPHDRAQKKRQRMCYSFLLPVKKVLAHDEASGRLAAEKLCRIYERLPFSEPRSAAGLKKYADIATALALPSASVNLPPVTSSIKTRKDKNGSQRKAFYYGTKWTMTDPVTGKTFQARVSIPVDRCNVKLEVPTLPTNVAGKDEEPELHPECPADREEEHKWAARVTRFVTSQLYGKLATKVSYDMLMNAQKERFLGGAHAQSGPYNGKPLFQLRFEGQETSRVISIYPHREVTKTLQWTSEEVDPGSADRLLPPIRIRPATIARCKPVLSAITQTWLSEAKILEAWKIGCMFADEINQSDSSDLFQSHLCTCTAESTHKLAHPCDRCGKPEICAALEHSNFGGRNCRSCNAGQSGGSDIMVRRVTDAAISEAKLLRKDADWRDIEKASMVEYLQAKYQNEDGKWKSAYTSRVLEVVDQGKARAKRPGTPSLDAIKQIHHMKDGTMRLHVNENVAPCELAFNYLKHIYPAGILAIVKEWVNSKKKEADREHLLNTMALLFEVHRKLPYRKSARVGEHMSESQWSILEHELLTCQVQPHSKQAPSRKHPIFEEIRPDWKPKNAETTERVIAEIETLFGSNVPRLSGCPFPFRDSSAVEEWTWWTAWKLFGRRVHRMWLLCNGKWIQLDGIVTVFLECIWAYFTQENADSLDLPAIMTIQDARHPLRFAFGKIHHNDGMRTRFTKPLPENINDRDDERVNFSIEAEIANRFKHDFDEDFYGYLGQLIKDVELDVELYNPDAQLIEQTDEELLGSAEAQIQTEGGLVIGDNFYENGNLMVRADGEEEPEWHGQDQYDNGSAESDEED